MQNTVQIRDRTFRIPTLTRRFLAYLIDIVVVLLPVVVLVRVGSVMDSGDASGGSIVLVVLGVLAVLAIPLYHPVALAVAGTTVGKRLLDMHVIQVRDCAKPGFGTALGRWLLFQVVPFGSIIAWIGALSNEENRGLHDKGAGTIVVMQ